MSDLSKIKRVFDDGIVMQMAKAAGVYERMLQARKESRLKCAHISQRVSNPGCVTDFLLWFGNTEEKENGWAAIFAFVQDYGSVSECELALTEALEIVFEVELN